MVLQAVTNLGSAVLGVLSAEQGLEGEEGGCSLDGYRPHWRDHAREVLDQGEDVRWAEMSHIVNALEQFSRTQCVEMALVSAGLK